MARNMNNFLNLCFTVRKLGPLSINVVRPIRLFRTSLYHDVWERGDNIVENYPLNIKDDSKYLMVKNKSNIMSEITTSSTVKELMSVITKYDKCMTGSEALEILKIMYYIDKKNRNEIINDEKKKKLSIICEVLKRNVAGLSKHNTIMALKILNYYRVSSCSVIMQILLQHVRESINFFSLSSLSYLYSIIAKLENNPLVEAISIAIPVLIESKIETELDRDDPDAMISVLKSLLRARASKSLVSQFFDELNNIDSSLISFKRAIRLLDVISRGYASDHIYIDLFKKCHQTILNSKGDINRDIVFTLINIQYPIAINLELYNETLFDACVTAVISKDMGIDAAIRLLRIFNIFVYTNNSLLDYIAGKYFEKSIRRRVPLQMIETLIDGLSIADYKPVFWDSLKDLLLNDDFLEYPPDRLIYLIINLASLDCFYSPFLAQVFTLKNWTLECKPSHWKMLFCDKIVESFYPKYQGPRLPAEFLITCQSVDVKWKSNDSLRIALENALGGPQYIINNVKSMIGCMIDQVVVMRKGGFPVAINNSENILTTLDELKPPSNSQVILFLYIPSDGSSRNTQRLIGYWSLLIRTLKFQTNYSVIPVQHDMWTKLSEAEQFRYISQAIRLKSDEMSASINS